MKYLQKSFSVSMSIKGITQEQWNRIFKKDKLKKKGDEVEVKNEIH